MLCSQGLENSKPRQTNALSKSIKDHQTKSIQGSQVCWVHRDSHPASLDAQEQFRVVSCTSSYMRYFEPSLPCTAKEILLCGCSEQSDQDTDSQEERVLAGARVQRDTGRRYTFASYTSPLYSALDAHALWWQRGFANAAERETFNITPAYAPRQPRRGNIV